ncbi:sulfur reduction protein DsrE [Alteromonas sp. 345S023]|uniref:Sulfur reduction protein DsrE n=1 Tax=Alteromonas profundi TaxID=2696062 RepID=A0A7X5LKU0_9ALTE|nr:DsrE family protein [Alteromonas profundi]NDV91208.1 sulfur reduction protein DsrE [Alteromonas profundi]
MTKLLVRFTHSPYSSSDSASGLDFTLAATNYGHEVAVLFENQGVLQLLQSPSLKHVKNHSKRLASMPFFDIEDSYVCQNSFEEITKSLELGQPQFDALIQNLEAQFIDTARKVELFESVDHVVTF